jgi:hypothetical protein
MISLCPSSLFLWPCLLFAGPLAAQVSDTTSPPIPDTIDIPGADTLAFLPDTLNPRYTSFCHRIDVMFDDSLPGTAIRAFMVKYRAKPIGGIPYLRLYTVTVPEYPCTWADAKRLLTSMNLETGVEVAGMAERTGEPAALD